MFSQIFNLLLNFRKSSTKRMILKMCYQTGFSETRTLIFFSLAGFFLSIVFFSKHFVCFNTERTLRQNYETLFLNTLLLKLSYLLNWYFRRQIENPLKYIHFVLLNLKTINLKPGNTQTIEGKPSIALHKHI